MNHNTLVNAENMELTPALKDLSIKKAEHLYTIYKNISHINITFKVDKHEQIANGLIKVPGREMVAHATSDDLYKSIDLLIDKLSSQLRKYKEKLSEH